MRALEAGKTAYKIFAEVGAGDGVKIIANVLGKKLNPYRNGSTLYEFTIGGFDQTIYLRAKDSDFSVFKQVFIDKEYEDPSVVHQSSVVKLYRAQIESGTRPVIVDCGANIGMAAIWYARKFPDAIIVAIEPEPNNFAILQKNSAEYKNIITLNAGISDCKGRFSVLNTDGQSWSWQTIESDDGASELISIDDALSHVYNGSILIVKVDIEGFEDKLFRSNTDWIARAPVIVAETHDWLFPWRGTAHALNAAIVQSGVHDCLQKGENIFYYSHALLR